MFSKWRKSTTTTSSTARRSTGSPGPGSPAASPPPVTPDAEDLDFRFEVMEDAMQEKLKQGVRYNMKVLVRGDRGSGKSTLLRRLQGRPFDPKYTKTPQLNAATIHWSSKKRANPVQPAAGGVLASLPMGAPPADKPDIVKVEVWDVVDQGFHTPAALARYEKMIKQIGPNVPKPEPPLSDAASIDVYRDAHVAVFVVDATKADALTYLKRELMKVPKTVCVLVMRNKCDLIDEIVITEADIQEFLDQHHRPASTPFMVQCARQNIEKVDKQLLIPPMVFSCSLTNCYGLKQLYQYLNVPFEYLKIIELEAQLKAHWDEVASVQETVRIEANESYLDYCDWLAERGGNNSMVGLRRNSSVLEGEALKTTARSGGSESPEPNSPSTPSRRKSFANMGKRLWGGRSKSQREDDPSPSPKPASPKLKMANEPNVTHTLDPAAKNSFANVSVLDDAFFDDVSDSGSEGMVASPGGTLRKQEGGGRGKVESDEDSEDMTAAQLMQRRQRQAAQARTAKEKKNGAPTAAARGAKGGPAADSDSDGDSNSGGGAGGRSDTEAKAAAAARREAEEEAERARREQEKRERKEAKRREKEEAKRAAEAAAAAAAAERAQWEARRAAEEQARREEEEQRLRELSEFAAVSGDGDEGPTAGLTLDDDFFNDVDGGDAGDESDDADVLAAAAAPSQQHSPEPSPRHAGGAGGAGDDRLAQLFKISAGAADSPAPQIPADDARDGDEGEEDTGVSNAAMLALQEAMASMQANIMELPEAQPLPPDAGLPKKEKKEKKPKKDKEGKEKKEKKDKADKKEKKGKKEKKDKKEKKRRAEEEDEEVEELSE